MVSCYGFGHDDFGQRRRSEGHYSREYFGSCAARTLGKHFGSCAARSLGKHFGPGAARSLGKHISSGASRTLELTSGGSR